MIKHIVLMKKNEKLSKERRKELFDQLRQLSEIPEAINVEFGVNFSQLSKGYEIGLNIDFKNKDDLKTYNKHPIHLKVVNTLKDLGMEILVIDYESAK